MRIASSSHSTILGAVGAHRRAHARRTTRRARTRRPTAPAAPAVYGNISPDQIEFLSTPDRIKSVAVQRAR